MNKRELEFSSENPAEKIRADLYTPDEGAGPWPVVVMGGAIVQWAMTAPPIDLPLFGEVTGWRAAAPRGPARP